MPVNVYDSSTVKYSHKPVGTLRCVWDEMTIMADCYLVVKLQRLSADQEADDIRLCRLSRQCSCLQIQQDGMKNNYCKMP